MDSIWLTDNLQSWGGESQGRPSASLAQLEIMYFPLIMVLKYGIDFVVIKIVSLGMNKDVVEKVSRCVNNGSSCSG